MPENLRDDVHVPQPKTDGERTAIASICQLNLDLQMPMLIDTIDDVVDEQYISYPIRLYLIDRDGKIAYNGAQGPFGFDLDAWEEAITTKIG